VHVTVFSTRGLMTRCTIVAQPTGAHEIELMTTSGVVKLLMDEAQLAAFAQDINRHLDGQLAKRMRAVGWTSKTAPNGAVC